MVFKANLLEGKTSSLLMSLAHLTHTDCTGCTCGWSVHYLCTRFSAVQMSLKGVLSWNLLNLWLSINGTWIVPICFTRYVCACSSDRLPVRGGPEQCTKKESDGKEQWNLVQCSRGNNFLVALGRKKNFCTAWAVTCHLDFAVWRQQVLYGGIDQLAAHQHLESGMNTKNHYRWEPCSSPAHMHFPFQCTNVMPQQSSAIEESPPLQSTCTLPNASVCSHPCALFYSIN